MRFAPAILLLAAVASVLSGCMDHTMDHASGVSLTSAAPAVGGLQGSVQDDEARPIENATVVLVEGAKTFTTGTDGSFLFADVPEGTYTLAASDPFFNDTNRPVVILGDATAQVTLTMVKKPEFKPRNFTVPYTGSYDCAAVVVFIPGSCGILIENITCAYTPNYYCGDPFANKYAYKFNVEPHWETLLVQVVWTQGTASAIGGLRVYVQDGNTTQGASHGTTFAKVTGTTSPFTVRLDRGVPDPSADPVADKKAMIPGDGDAIFLKIYPDGDAADLYCNDSIGGCERGAGVSLDLHFTAYVTQFYNTAAPASFSGIPK